MDCLLECADFCRHGRIGADPDASRVERRGETVSEVQVGAIKVKKEGIPFPDENVEALAGGQVDCAETVMHRGPITGGGRNPGIPPRFAVDRVDRNILVHRYAGAGDILDKGLGETERLAAVEVLLPGQHRRTGFLCKGI